MNFGNLGIALGAFTDEQKAQAEEARKAEQFGWQRAEYERKKAEQDAQGAVNSKYAKMREQLRNGDTSFAEGLMKEYNSQQGAFGDGHTVATQSTPNGTVMHHIDPKGAVVKSYNMDPQTIGGLLNDAHMQELMYTSPQLFTTQYNANRDHGLKLRDVGTKEEANRIHSNYYTGKLQNDEVQIANWYSIQQEANRIAAARAATEAARAAADHARSKMGQPITLYGEGDSPVIATPVMGKDGTVTYVQSNLPAGLRFTPKASGQQVVSPIDQINLKAYDRALEGLSAPRVTGDAVKDATAQANYDRSVAGLRQSYQVAHLFPSAGGGNDTPVREAPKGAAPAQAKSAAAPSAGSSGFMQNRVQPGFSAAGLPLSGKPSRPYVEQPMFGPIDLQLGLPQVSTDLAYNLNPDLNKPRGSR